jgi:hypothetical protein
VRSGLEKEEKTKKTWKKKEPRRPAGTYRNKKEQTERKAEEETTKTFPKTT